MLRKTLLACVGTLLLIASVGYAQKTAEEWAISKGGKRMMAAEIKELFNKPTKIEYKTNDPSIWGINTYDLSGRAVTEWHNKGAQGEDIGTWRLNGDQFCLTWTKRFDGAERCAHVYRMSSTEFGSVAVDGSFGVWFTFKP